VLRRCKLLYFEGVLFIIWMSRVNYFSSATLYKLNTYLSQIPMAGFECGSAKATQEEIDPRSPWWLAPSLLPAPASAILVEFRLQAGSGTL
jgi:hypothetical protein